ncbi:MAG: ABC transporter permease [Chloroflexota bacterium]
MTATRPAYPVAGARPDRSRGALLRDTWKGYLTAVRLGWATEANWTDPVLFAIYQVAKPIASVLILVTMLRIISGGNGDPQVRAYMVVGSALWAFVVGGVAGIAWSVLDDRERYRMLRYLAVSPHPLLIMLMGRGTARLGTAAAGAVITLVFGVLVLNVGFELSAVDWPLLVVSMALGLVAVVALGVLLAATVLMTRVDAWSYPEAVAGALFLLTGAVFPITVLPLAIQAVSLVIPLTWWLEGVRRALFPQIVDGIGGTGSLWQDLTGTQVPDDTTLLVMLFLSTALATVVSVAVYRWCEHRARERGLLDQTTGS